MRQTGQQRALCFVDYRNNARVNHLDRATAINTRYPVCRQLGQNFFIADDGCVNQIGRGFEVIDCEDITSQPDDRIKPLQ